jgi:hypothetical protein
VNDSGSPLFGSSKGRERGSSAFSFLRGRRSGDTQGLISFNLLPQETDDPIPGRVSETRLLLVEYWRRDQRAAARAADLAEAESAVLPPSAVFVNGAPVTPPTSLETPIAVQSTVAGQQPAVAEPPMAARPVEEPRPTQAAYADPNRKDFLSSLKARSRPSHSSSEPPAAASGSSLIIDLPSSSHVPGDGASQPGSQSASALFAEETPRPAAAPDRARSLFEPRPREAAAPAEAESVFARAAAAMPSLPAPMPMEEEAPVAPPPPEQGKVRALQAFLRRVETRRQQIETESLA